MPVVVLLYPALLCLFFGGALAILGHHVKKQKRIHAKELNWGKTIQEIGFTLIGVGAFVLVASAVALLLGWQPPQLRGR